VLAALVNGAVMLALVASIAWHAVERFQQPREVSGPTVVGVALLGLVVNLLVFYVLSRGERNLNVKGAMLHVMGDLLGSVAALVSGIVIMATGWMPIDPILSLLICVLILVAAVRLLMESAHVVMEGVPQGLDLDKVRATMHSVRGVQGIHDLHVWQVSSDRVALSAHVVVADLGDWPGTLAALNQALLDAHDIDHPTLQPELVDSESCEHQPEACR
jgi:cobalt-zinc-cadmium efflux system protein